MTWLAPALTVPRRVPTADVPRRVFHRAAPQRGEEQGGGALADALRRAGLAEKRK
jgi:hypothetical protein